MKRSFDGRAAGGAIVTLLLVACHAGTPAPEHRPIPAALPESLGFDAARLDRVREYLASQVDSAYPGAVVAVGRHGRLALLAAVGHYSDGDDRPVEPETVYDLASLTKVIGLTTACMILVQEGKLDLDAPAQRYVPEFRGPDKNRITIRLLLTHSAGLAADLPLYDSTRSRAAALTLVDTSPLLSAPGTDFVYSDLSAIVLMQVVERITSQSLDAYLEARVFGPLGMAATRFNPPRSWLDHIAPTELDTMFRHRLIRGEVHDESAARLGGVSGNAGLFSDAPDLVRFATWLMAVRAGTAGHGPRGTTPGLTSETVTTFTTRQNIPPGSTRALGWDTASDSGYSSAGSKLSRRSFGHTGYTGTSIWMDPDNDLFVILLTNRVNPTRANTKILEVRAKVADLVADALVGDGRGR
ncbi:MAG TPA: serine hydrolase domain-containing protein [Gemmatimonadales bacterium]|nr:serine hydrolase domain-containing protein [Gemmatimonadales bacterium]